MVLVGSIPREPLPKPIHQPQTKPKVEPVTALNSLTTISTEKSQSSTTTLLTPVASNVTNKTTSEKIEEKVVTVAKFNEVLERLAKLEMKYEQQEQTIEDLRNRLQVETDMRMLLQEKVMHNNVQV